MKLLDSLLDAIVRLEGDALVMHVGEKPYVVTASSSMNAYRGPLAWGQVELSSRVLTFDAVSSMLVQILPADQQLALTEFGAIEHEIPSPVGVADRFTVVAARGGEDVWVELRRRPVETAQAETSEAVPPAEAPAEQVAVPPASDVAAVPAEPVAADAKAVAEAPAVAPAAEAVAELPVGLAVEPQTDPGAHEIELVADAQAQVDEQPAADVQLEPNESIVVAIPGHAAEEFELNAVPDNAIQIIDDEPQGVPTEEEVDAMLAATAAALLTSGLAGDVVPGDDAQASAGDPVGEDETESVLNTAAAAAPHEVEVGADVELPVAEPAFELSPPPLVARAGDEAPEDAEVVAEAPVGTPLFSDDAVLAAAPQRSAEPVPEPVPAAPVVEEVSVVGEALALDDATVAEPLAVAAEALAEPVQHEEPVTMQPPVALDTVDVRAERPASEELSARAPASGEPRAREPASGVPWARELEDMRQAVDETPAEAVVVDTLNAGAEQAVSEPTPQAWTPSAAEMPMEVTPELQRQEEPVAEVAHRAAASTETPSPEAPEPVNTQPEDQTRQAVVVPLARTHFKPESVSVPFTPSEDAALMHTLRVAAARGASTVYVVAQSKPMIRIDGEIGPLESEPTLTAADVDRLVMELAPPRRRDALQNGPVEWLCDVPEIGRVRCLTFRDHRGPGVLFRMFPPRAISADQLGLTPEVQTLCQQSDGLVLVTGARASGKSTLLNAFVDLINRTRSDHLITIETQIGFVHESRRSFISQRESRGDAELAATYARAALREDPDVMMIEDLKSFELVSAALEAAESGRLVLASVPASSTIGALERLIEVFPADRRAKARTSLATALRGVIAQVLLRRVKGGRVAAREILLNTPAVSQLVLEGKMFQLPVALDSGRRHGMVPLTDSLAAHVRDGTVHVAEAYRKALDRAALVALLKREGIDTSFAERLA